MNDLVAGFRRAMGRDPTTLEMETLTPLFMRAGYQDDDLLWGIVFLFARQFAGAEAAARAVEAAGERVAERVDQVRKSARRADRFERLLLRLTMVLFLVGLGALGSWHVRGWDLARARYDAIEVVRAHSPSLAKELYGIPALETDRLAWCGSREADAASGMGLDQLRWCADDDAQVARQLPSLDLNWCADDDAGGRARRLGDAGIKWCESDLGVQARKTVDVSTLGFLASEWGQTAKWAWSYNRPEIYQLTAMVKCEGEYLSIAPNPYDPSAAPVCRFKKKYRDRSYWWVPFQ